MASGNTIWVLEPEGSKPPLTLFATLDTIADASTPQASLLVLDFDPTTAEIMDWFRTVPSHYAGGGFTISWKGGTDNTSVLDFTVEVRIVKLADAVILTGDLGLDAATAVTLTDTPPTTPINKLNYSATGALTHANAGSPAVGDRMGIRVKRNATGNTGDLQLAEVLILET